MIEYFQGELSMTWKDNTIFVIIKETTRMKAIKGEPVQKPSCVFKAE